MQFLRHGCWKFLCIVLFLAIRENLQNMIMNIIFCQYIFTNIIALWINLHATFFLSYRILVWNFANVFLWPIPLTEITHHANLHICIVNQLFLISLWLASSWNKFIRTGSRNLEVNYVFQVQNFYSRFRRLIFHAEDFVSNAMI